MVPYERHQQRSAGNVTNAAIGRRRRRLTNPSTVAKWSILLLLLMLVQCLVFVVWFSQTDISSQEEIIRLSKNQSHGKKKKKNRSSVLTATIDHHDHHYDDDGSHKTASHVSSREQFIQSHLKAVLLNEKKQPLLSPAKTIPDDDEAGRKSSGRHQPNEWPKNRNLQLHLEQQQQQQQQQQQRGQKGQSEKNAESLTRRPIQIHATLTQSVPGKDKHQRVESIRYINNNSLIEAQRLLEKEMRNVWQPDLIQKVLADHKRRQRDSAAGNVTSPALTSTVRLESTLTEQELQDWKFRRKIAKTNKDSNTVTYSKHHSTNTKQTIYDEYLRELQNNQDIAGDSRYLEQNNNTRLPLPYGFVLRELLQRLLGGKVQRSKVLVKSAREVGQKVLRRVKQLNHSAIQVDRNVSLEEWWATRPAGFSDDIKLAFLDLCGDEAFVSSKEASAWLSHSSTSRPYLEYIVVGITSSTGGAHYNATILEADFKKGGYETVRALIRSGYKVQLLAASDYWNTGNPIFSQTGRGYEPNSLLDESTLDAFFRWGARSAALSKALVNNFDPAEAVFHAYLFATRSLDLAIPSRREYIQAGQFPNTPFDFANVERERREMIQRVPLIECSMHSRVRVEFKSGSALKSENRQTAGLFNDFDVFCDGQNVSQVIKDSPEKSNLIDVWLSDNLEAICVRVKCETILTGKRTATLHSNEKFRQVACGTRILPKKIVPALPAVPERSIKHPNLLVITIESLSRTQFDFLLPRTKQILERRGFFMFEKYTKNRDTESDLQGPVGGDRQDWFWNKLHDKGYATFQLENSCPTRKSSAANTTHGHSGLFCVHFSRPNCVGQALAAEHLLGHASQFVETYHGSDLPWAAFLSLVDANEDTMTLAGILDKPLRQFMVNTMAPRLSNTFVVLLSDSGLSRGSYFQTDAGEKESYEPLLFMRLPEEHNEDAKEGLKSNTAKYVSSADVFETILEIIGIKERGNNDHGASLLSPLPPERNDCQSLASEQYCALISSSGTDRKIPSVPAILSFYADIPRDHRFKQRRCFPLASVVGGGNVFAKKQIGRRCRCATSHRDWYDCEEHPWWSNNVSLPGKVQPNTTEYFAFSTCSTNEIAVDIRVSRQEGLLQRSRKLSKPSKLRPPNILFLEVDSVSVPYADRHLPLTRNLLKKHRLDGRFSAESCPRGLCGIEFVGASTVGPNSVSNQVAALSGCLATHMHKSCFGGREPRIGEICRDPNVSEFGMRLQSIGPKLHTIYCSPNTTAPFLYDIAQQEGYITIFGEEFCYSGSPWVLQDNVFPIEADIMPHKMFCRLASQMNPDAKENELFKVAVESSAQQPCLSTTGFTGAEKQKMGLELIKQTWDAFVDTPKFAYLNAISAHSYEPDWSRTALGAEAYDVHFSQFLKDFLHRSDANNTIIIVRSDHGFQGSDTATIDFNTQVEHHLPWTEMIVPDDFPADRLFSNHGKTVTSFDFYKTILSLISSTESSEPSWAYNLMTEDLPLVRDCQTARIPTDFCPAISPFPNFGTCNMFEPTQAIFCQDPIGQGSVERIDVKPVTPASIKEALKSSKSKSQHRKKRTQKDNDDDIKRNV